jgi:hypothetical protein
VYLTASQGKLCSGTNCGSTASFEVLDGGPTLSINKDELGLLPNAESPLNTNTETKILPRRRHSNASAEKHWQRIGQYCLIHDIVLVYSLTSGVRFLDNPLEQPQMAHWQQSSSIRNR